MNPSRFHLALCIALLAAGCDTGTTPPPVTSSPSGGAGTDGDQHDSAAVQVRVASWEEVEQAIAAHQGKVVVLDVWSTWCQPCVREFPGLVKLHQAHGDKVVCMSLNSNYAGLADEPPEAAMDQVKAFLEQQSATFENFISSTQDMELYQKLDSPSVPIIRVYDKSGKLHKQFDDSSGEYGQEGFNYEQHVTPVVEELLAQ